ncbi:MAG TPA: hypothetical protein VMX11_00185 [Actinomycetes bacterium]|nr:hypothetical protein [Actinomycetes bacterium]
MAATFDINTTDTVAPDGTLPGQTVFPLRYTTTEADTIRVGLWCVLSTIVGTLQFDTEEGLDVLAMLSPTTSDAERSSLVRDPILAYPGVAAIDEEPIVATTEQGQLVSISVTAILDSGVTLDPIVFGP